jgi:hypothetical protein
MGKINESNYKDHLVDFIYVHLVEVVFAVVFVDFNSSFNEDDEINLHQRTF